MINEAPNNKRYWKWNKYGKKMIKKIIKMAIDEVIGELVITYKDRLARFGYELMEWLIKTYSNGEIKIIHKKDEQTPEEEITNDIIQIMNVYVAKINGRKSNKNL